MFIKKKLLSLLDILKPIESIFKKLQVKKDMQCATQDGHVFPNLGNV